jgi:hemoglobin
MVDLPSSSALFDRIGGSATFDALVRKFYEGIREDERLRPMYPEGDLEGAIWRLSSFLQQYFGGPMSIQTPKSGGSLTCAGRLIR